MKLLKNDNAFTGLEAAIVLIAFVVVAAVFSYVVLGAGFFTTQKSQEVVHTGVSQASSSMEIIGNVYGYANTADNGIAYVVFTVGNTAGGSPIDVSKMIITYICDKDNEVYPFDNTNSYNPANPAEVPIDPAFAYTDNLTATKWGILNIINDNTNENQLLEPGEQFIIAVPLENPGVNTKFSLNLQPAVGSVFPIQRTAPAFIEEVNILR